MRIAIPKKSNPNLTIFLPYKFMLMVCPLHRGC